MPLNDFVIRESLELHEIMRWTHHHVSALNSVTCSLCKITNTILVPEAASVGGVHNNRSLEDKVVTAAFSFFYVVLQEEHAVAGKVLKDRVQIPDCSHKW